VTHWRNSLSVISSAQRYSVRQINSIERAGVHFVQVFSGSPADGRLQRGDVFVSINNHDVSRMQQNQAEDIIKATGSALSLVVKRYYERLCFW